MQFVFRKGRIIQTLLYFSAKRSNITFIINHLRLPAEKLVFFVAYRNHILYSCFFKVPNSFSGRWTALYDSRKVSRDWNGIIDDFALCFSSFYEINETNGNAVCRSPVNAQHLFVTWSRFKRDAHHDVKAPTNHILVNSCSCFTFQTITILLYTCAGNDGLRLVQVKKCDARK